MGRRVVVQHSSLGGFNAVEFQLKVSALHVQWVRHFVASLSSRVSFMVFWFSSVLNAPPHVVFFPPPALSFSRLPPFYVSLLQACKGSFSVSSPVVPFVLSQPSLLTFFLSLRMSPPHCVVKFRPLFGPLYWSVTWCQLFLFVLECPVIDLSWKVAHGVLYTAERLSSFGYNISTACFCSRPLEFPQHLFFDCLLATTVLSWLQSWFFLASPLSPSLLVRHVLFGFSEDELHVIPWVFVYLLNISKFCVWWARKDFHFHAIRVLSPVCIAISLCFFVVFVLTIFSVSLFVSGEVVVSLRLLLTIALLSTFCAVRLHPRGEPVVLLLDGSVDL